MTDLEWARARVAERRADRDRYRSSALPPQGETVSGAIERKLNATSAAAKLAEAEDWLRHLESTTTEWTRRFPPVDPEANARVEAMLAEPERSASPIGETASKAELRTLHLAISNARRAFEDNDLSRLATINPALQPLVDAAVAYARRQASAPQPVVQPRETFDGQGLTSAGHCVKCGALSGDNWSQCGGKCPVIGSPHYDPTWFSYGDSE